MRINSCSSDFPGITNAYFTLHTSGLLRSSFLPAIHRILRVDGHSHYELTGKFLLHFQLQWFSTFRDFVMGFLLVTCAFDFFLTLVYNIISIP